MPNQPDFQNAYNYGKEQKRMVHKEGMGVTH